MFITQGIELIKEKQELSKATKTEVAKTNVGFCGTRQARALIINILAKIFKEQTGYCWRNTGIRTMQNKITLQGSLVFTGQQPSLQILRLLNNR